MAEIAICGELGCLSFAGARTQSSWTSDTSNRHSWIIGSIEDPRSVNTPGFRTPQLRRTQGNCNRGRSSQHLSDDLKCLCRGLCQPQSWTALGILGNFVIHGDNRNAGTWYFSCPNFERNKVQVPFQQPQELKNVTPPLPPPVEQRHVRGGERAGDNMT